MENVQRNVLEYTADGWDWTAVAEETDHYACPDTGELVHPIHVEMAALERLDKEEKAKVGGGTQEGEEEAAVESSSTDTCASSRDKNNSSRDQ